MMRTRLVDSIARGEPYDRNVEVRTLNGRHTYHHWGRPYRDVQGQLIGAICGVINITDHDDLVRALRNANARIESISRGKTQFLASIGGEMQGPLQNIIAMIDLALNQDDPKRRLEPLTVARSVAGNLLHVLDDLQLLNRAKTGRLQLALEAVDLRTLVQRQVDVIAEVAQAKGLALEVDFDLALQSLVWCDPLRLRQILGNLLGNALKFTEQGVVRVRLCARGQGDGMVGVQLDVIDTGFGIPEADQAGLLDPFAFDLGSQRIRHGGTGLGLALCRSLVELMDGAISVRSRPDVGTEISLELVFPAASA